MPVVRVLCSRWGKLNFAHLIALGYPVRAITLDWGRTSLRTGTFIFVSWTSHLHLIFIPSVPPAFATPLCLILYLKRPKQANEVISWGNPVVRWTVGSLWEMTPLLRLWVTAGFAVPSQSQARCRCQKLTWCCLCVFHVSFSHVPFLLFAGRKVRSSRQNPLNPVWKPNYCR